MKYLIEFIRLLFPFRSHLLLQVEYLRAQLAQKDRRIVELSDALAERQKPVVKERVEPRPVPLPVPPIAAWKARLPREKGPDDYEHTEAAVTVPNAPDAGRKDQADGAGDQTNTAGNAAIS